MQARFQEGGGEGGWGKRRGHSLDGSGELRLVQGEAREIALSTGKELVFPS